MTAAKLDVDKTTKRLGVSDCETLLERLQTPVAS